MKCAMDECIKTQLFKAEAIRLLNHNKEKIWKLKSDEYAIDLNMAKRLVLKEFKYMAFERV